LRTVFLSEGSSLRKPLSTLASIGSYIMNVNETEALDIARKLWDMKRTIHFQLYQARAKGYNIIRARTP
jgi:hypothetical protein